MTRFIVTKWCSSMSEDYFHQVPFKTAFFNTDDFADNPEPRCPCVLLLDKSGSMSGKPIDELNKGLSLFKSELIADSLASKRVEIAIVTFGPVCKEVEFCSVSNFAPPVLIADSDTPMGEAIKEALEMLRQRKDEYRQNGIAYYRPWVFLITDGGPTDEWKSAAALVKDGEEKNNFAFFAVAVEGADIEKLKQISVRPPLPLNGLNFKDLFQWLSQSMKSVSCSTPNTKVLLPPTSGWTSI